MPSELAVVIVSWNTRELTLDALRTLHQDLDAHGPESTVWVMDNASSDGTPDAVQTQFPQATLIANATNLGFAGGNNYALRRMGFSDPSGISDPERLPRAVYLLNPDTRTEAGATRTLFDALFTLPRAGVVGAQLAYGDGSFQHGAFRFPGLGQLIVDLFSVPGRLYESGFNGRYPRRKYARGDPFSVDHTLGATMMLRREAILQAGLFDEGYFMYCEEIDWSARIRQAGWEIYAVPAARVIHLAGQSTTQVHPQSVLNLWRSRMRLFERYYPPVKLWLARRIIRLGMRRQIALVRRACAAGELSLQDRDALIDTYQTVQTL
ncbi:MAG TPA: glycosyltransferase family 2 protein [Aggregatilineaceae bacterium]|nr:glycosyltransferase family 2 protein [Aggregatilineaceae bacterium]